MNDNKELDGKLKDLEVPGAVIEMDPDEAEQLGAFVEDALTEEEALDSAFHGDAD
ncbi:conjugal transfer protein TraD [Microbulbifer discodermiae]|uniref:conjugal transfer protein TraD n=1 Tax=Microbulbifer sp. 2201CG32-9 TaxID=3232309 RepID=UPI00345C1F14